VVFDLGSVKTVTHGIQEVFQHANPSNIRKYRYEVGDSSTGPWTIVAEGTNPDSQGAGYKHEFSDGPVDTRYIRFTMVSNFGQPAFTVLSDMWFANVGGLIAEDPPPVDPPETSLVIPAFGRLRGI
jgi:hypothetical protein